MAPKSGSRVVGIAASDGPDYSQLCGAVVRADRAESLAVLLELRPHLDDALSSRAPAVNQHCHRVGLRQRGSRGHELLALMGAAHRSPPGCRLRPVDAAQSVSVPMRPASEACHRVACMPQIAREGT